MNIKEIYKKIKNELPVEYDIKIYQEQSIYWEKIINSPHSKDKYNLAISLNIKDKIIYLYRRDKEELKDINEIIPNFRLSERNNVFFHNIENYSLNESCEIFYILVKNAEDYLKNILIQNTKQKNVISGDYYDDMDNKISAPIGLVNVHFQFLGSNNKILISPKANLKNTFIECRGNNNTIIIDENVRMVGHWRLGFGCTLKIGKNSSSTNPVYITVAENTQLTIGEDCMFATNNQIRTDDAHPIYDVNTGKRVNMSKDIQIGDHVWIGYGATILSGSAIGSGSVIGAGSIVRNKFPNNCVIAGTPAKVVKKDIFWERPLLLNMSEEVVYSEEERRQKNYCKNTMETE
ncbi:acyltransferase [Actinobacillus pleuropneumoniae]|uniref:Acyltransferase n=1 Tax=Actinobacillus pleuropneumoniae TaxID=715 RepID=A0ABM6X6U0_ACTPL|nr:acyltransferase [Actinobacillus pleuropneumoniae]ASU15426.1 Polysialic acid O-acetyltransferase [Actinobacillus pleuropneumoniae]AWG96004.1 acyltransferase [Actinobacillus pleuropneumoniae serovar 1 str. 4074]AXA22074.1 acyltransferase [Actinobacillus pleuropneumoniae]MBL4536463.1 acyltransferase [Actinobacillus pleuropneumoniae]MCI1069141.1 acyltransferase [Actinobacillus pleuropneumoniae]